MSTRDILVAAKQVLETKGWHQGNWGSEQEGYCALGALRVVAETVPMSCTWYDEYREAAEALRVHVADFGFVAEGDHADRFSVTVPLFNDRETTTKADILALFDKAIANV